MIDMMDGSAIELKTKDYRRYTPAVGSRLTDINYGLDCCNKQKQLCRSWKYVPMVGRSFVVAGPRTLGSRTQGCNV